VPPKEFRLIHLLGIIPVHVHQLESMKCGCKTVLHPPTEKKEKDEQHSCLVKKREKKKGEVYSAIHKTTMGLYPHLSLALDP